MAFMKSKNLLSYLSYFPSDQTLDRFRSLTAEELTATYRVKDREHHQRLVQAVAMAAAEYEKFADEDCKHEVSLLRRSK